MREVVERLKDRIGVRGALLMTSDGVVITNALGEGADADAVAALASAFVRKALASAGDCGLGRVRRVTLAAAFGRLVFVTYEEMVLVIVTEPHLDLDLTLLEIAGPARRLRELSRLDGQD